MKNHARPVNGGFCRSLWMRRIVRTAFLFASIDSCASSAASFAWSAAACCESRIASTTAVRASSTASRTASLSAPGGSLISTPSLLTLAEKPAGDDAADADADAVADAAEATGALDGVATGTRGEMRTPFLSIEIVTSSPESIRTAGCRLPDCRGTGATGGIGVAGLIVTSSLLPGLDVAMSVSTSDAISSRIDNRMNLVHVMPTSQLP